MTGQFKNLTYYEYKGVYATVKYLTHAFPDLYERVKLMVKAKFSLVICSTFKSFVEATKL